MTDLDGKCLNVLCFLYFQYILALCFSQPSPVQDCIYCPKVWIHKTSHCLCVCVCVCVAWGILILKKLKYKLLKEYLLLSLEDGFCICEAEPNSSVQLWPGYACISNRPADTALQGTKKTHTIWARALISSVWFTPQVTMWSFKTSCRLLVKEKLLPLQSQVL